jgi:DNA-binding NarL/FixJ family response regulator
MIGDTSDLATAELILSDYPADLVAIDADFKRVDEYEIISKITSKKLSKGVTVLTLNKSNQGLLKAIQSGINGYLL